MRLTLFPLAILLLSSACEKSPADPTLLDVKNQLVPLVRHIMMGDTATVSLQPFEKSDWFLIVPPMADAVSFETAAPAFAKAQASAMPDLFGKTSTTLALITDGEVEYVAELNDPFYVEKVLAKPGKVTNGLRVLRLAGHPRSYKIVTID